MTPQEELYWARKNPDVKDIIEHGSEKYISRVKEHYEFVNRGDTMASKVEYVELICEPHGIIFHEVKVNYPQV